MDHLGFIYALLCLHCVKVALPSADQNQFISTNLVMTFLTYWSLDTRNTKCPGETVACSSMVHLLFSLARVYPFQGPTTNSAELRVVGTERKKSLNGSLGVMVSEDTPAFTSWLLYSFILPIEGLTGAIQREPCRGLSFSSYTVS